MSRVIKFRVWDTELRQWISNLGMKPNNVLVDGKESGRFAVMQFTGMRDKNGKEIYEGDILAYKSALDKHEGKIFHNVVEFAIGQSLCGWRMRNKRTVVRATPYKFGFSEIIGNIYENPELLQEKGGEG